MKLSFLEEEKLSNNSLVVGIDEVGRGCLAGPVYVCGYMKTDCNSLVDGVNDSKSISGKKREVIFQQLKVEDYLISWKSSSDIDNNGIARCIEAAINDICEYFRMKYTQKLIFLIDGYFKYLPVIENSEIYLVEKGDTIHYTVAAASIIAKVSRDNYMRDLSSKYDERYRFTKNVGYGTQDHIKAIKEIGLSDIHRISFCRNFL